MHFFGQKHLDPDMSGIFWIFDVQYQCVCVCVREEGGNSSSSSSSSSSVFIKLTKSSTSQKLSSIWSKRPRDLSTWSATLKVTVGWTRYSNSINYTEWAGITTRHATQRPIQKRQSQGERVRRPPTRSRCKRQGSSNPSHCTLTAFFRNLRIVSLCKQFTVGSWPWIR